MDDDLTPSATPTPIEPERDQAGGGAPIAARSVVVGGQFHPSADFSHPLHETFDAGLVALEALESEDSREPLELLWDGRPTRAALKQVRLETQCPSFCAAQAWEVLTAMYEGSTLSAVCRRPGMPKRSVVLWWAELVPEFGAMLERAQVSLGGALRDKAVELLDGDEPDAAVSRAALAVAGAFDRRISKGEDGGSVVQGLTVNVSW